jgi:transcriptional regulator with XRE-family HTH domain
MIFDKIKYYRRLKGVTQLQMATDLKINRSTLADYETNSCQPNIEKLFKIADYFGISVDDLVNMKKTYESKLKILAITTDNKDKENIEYIPVKARAGYLAGYGDPEFLSTLPRFNLPTLTKGTFRAFEIQGDSMPPIHDGFIVIGRYVENWKELKDNNRYILLTKNDGIVFKRITNNISKNGTLILSSDNTEYSPFVISIEDLMEAWSFYAFVGFPDKYEIDTFNYVLNKLNCIENKMDKIISNS